MSVAATPLVTPSAVAVHPVLINGKWRVSESTGTFTATNPRTREPLPEMYPISGWADIDSALTAAASAATALRAMPDSAERIATFLEKYALGIETSAEAMIAAASSETALPIAPRLSAVELPRTTGQLRQAAAAARDGSWCRPTIDTKLGLRSHLAPLGPIWVIGPNNFPFAFNGIAGGEFAAAIASGNPVIAKGHPLHPTTTRLLAEAAQVAASAAGLPDGTVQMLYHLSPADGLTMVEDPRLAAVAFTGSRAGGLKIKAAADAAGKLFFGEMSSINPTVILPGALAENGVGIVEQFAGSVLMGTGQFCTKPGIVMMLAGPETQTFISAVTEKMNAAPAGVLFSKAGESSLASAIQSLRSAGAELVAGSTEKPGGGFGISNTLLRVPGGKFLTDPQVFQTEAFGNAALVVVADSSQQLLDILKKLEGNLTGTVYSAAGGNDDDLYDAVAAILRPKVGRLLNDKMPTGVAVSPAMCHGGPFPASSQPHFTAVGLPASMLRFTQLESFDNVRPHRLPACLQNKNPTGRVWRMIDGNPSQNDV
jgi:alpha-ketoglutaric semialdehyde dehydrogenase